MVIWKTGYRFSCVAKKDTTLVNLETLNVTSLHVNCVSPGNAFAIICDNERRQNLSAALNRSLLRRSISGRFLCCSADQNTCAAPRKNHPALSTLSQHSKETLPGCSKTLRLSVLPLSPGIGYYSGWWEFIWISPPHQYSPSELFKKRQSLLAVHSSLACT